MQEVTELEKSIGPSRFDHIKYDEVRAAKQERLKAAARRVEAAIEKLDEELEAFDALICTELVNERGHVPANGELARIRLEQVFGCGEDGPRGADGALVALEEAYMWCGKTLRDQQIERNGSAELQEGRGNT